MASMPVRPVQEPAPTSAPEGDAHRSAAPPQKTRAQRFAEAHARVIERHAETFEKLAK